MTSPAGSARRDSEAGRRGTQKSYKHSTNRRGRNAVATQLPHCRSGFQKPTQHSHSKSRCRETPEAGTRRKSPCPYYTDRREIPAVLLFFREIVDDIPDDDSCFVNMFSKHPVFESFESMFTKVRRHPAYRPSQITFYK